MARVRQAGGKKVSTVFRVVFRQVGIALSADRLRPERLFSVVARIAFVKQKETPHIAVRGEPVLPGEWGNSLPRRGNEF